MSRKAFREQTRLERISYFRTDFMEDRISKVKQVEPSCEAFVGGT